MIHLGIDVSQLRLVSAGIELSSIQMLGNVSVIKNGKLLMPCYLGVKTIVDLPTGRFYEI